MIACARGPKRVVGIEQRCGSKPIAFEYYAAIEMTSTLEVLEKLSQDPEMADLALPNA